MRKKNLKLVEKVLLRRI